MPSHHLERTNDDIRRVLAEKLPQCKDPRLQQPGVMLSVTRTETTVDLRHCKVYISVLGDVAEKDLLRGLRSASGYLRRELGRSLSLRYTPELTFVLDDSIAHGAHINQLIQELGIEQDAEN